MDIQYRYFDNLATEARAKAVLSNFTYLLPPWLRELQIHSAASENPEAAANTLVKPEYGLATIEIFPIFWDLSEKKQLLCLLHEVLHVAHGRVLSLVQRRLLHHLKEINKDLHDFAEDEFRERTEEFIENLARALDFPGRPE